MIDYCLEMGEFPYFVPCECADPDCPRCEGKGQYPVADGPDDYIIIRCDCGGGE